MIRLEVVKMKDKEKSLPNLKLDNYSLKLDGRELTVEIEPFDIDLDGKELIVEIEPFKIDLEGYEHKLIPDADLQDIIQDLQEIEDFYKLSPKDLVMMLRDKWESNNE